MLEYEQYRLDLQALEQRINDLEISLDIKGKLAKIEDLEKQASAQDFWDDMENSQKVLQQTKQLKDKVDAYKRLKQSWEDGLVLIDLANEENDESMLDEVKVAVDEITATVEKMTLETLLSGNYDRCNAIMTFHSGAGGTESQDWVQMLLRMYQMYAQKNGYTTETIDILPGDDAGIKSATISINGLNAYGYLKAEKGIHRLVRISPFDASGRRHTSFASIEVMPEIDDEIEINIRPEDLKIDTYRSSGAGGQHVNKTDSAVRITHIPTGIVTACQTQRSQHQNKDYAMKMLKAKLAELAEQQQKEKIEDIKGVQKEIAWGSQIRSYVFHPYNLVKDHRTGFEMGNIGAVMDGDITGFINAYLKAMSLGQLENK
ncbi:MAG: peptide chain release factor 2 [Ruminococcaceae bacterium]|nr:peptide chain release factor 2 [Oscillospiraceae bacterium]